MASRLASGALLGVLLVGAAGCASCNREAGPDASAPPGTAPDEQPASSLSATASGSAPGDAPVAEAGCSRKADLSTMTGAELRRLAVERPCSLGSLSLGRPESGALVNAVRLVDGARWVVAYPDNAWATDETIGFLQQALTKAYDGQPPAAPKIYVGDLSSPWGGPLPPHSSHQSGRDADLGYPRLDPEDPWWTSASAHTIDAGRTWALLRALITDTDVELIFVDRSLQRPLRAHALRIGEDARWVDALFDLGRQGQPTLIRHVPEHLNHMHVRFYNPVAQSLGRAVTDLLARGIAPDPPVAIPDRRLPPAGRKPDGTSSHNDQARVEARTRTPAN
jgi:murein endopeptidase